MLVDVIRMRREGARIPSETLKAATPVRGHLSVVSRMSRSRRQDSVMLALLLDVTSKLEEVLPPLDEVRLTALRGDEFVLQGFEEVLRGRRLVDNCVQSWWCKLVLPSEAGTPSLWAAETGDELGDLAASPFR